jgi:anti-sigma factor RsiW
VNEICRSPFSLDELFAYRRGELDPAREAAVEEHYFGCAACSERLAWLESLEGGIVAAIRLGLLDIVITRRSVERLTRAGAVLRRYDVPAGGSVNCTAAPGEDMTIVTLRPALRPGVPLTLVTEMEDHATGQRQQSEHPVFQNPESGEVILGLASWPLQALGHVHVSITVHGGETADAEVLGRFEMNHSPWSG